MIDNGNRKVFLLRKSRSASVAVILILGVIASTFALACDNEGQTMSDEQKLEQIETMYKKYERKFPEVTSISVAELQELQKGETPIVIVDVREPKEYAVSMIPDAITAEEFQARRSELEGATVVTYCTAGYRSGFAAQKLMQEGWEVRNLAGSILSWTHAGLPLVKGEEPTTQVHVYSKGWDLSAEGYEPVW